MLVSNDTEKRSVPPEAASEKDALLSANFLSLEVFDSFFWFSVIVYFYEVP